MQIAKIINNINDGHCETSLRIVDSSRGCGGRVSVSEVIVGCCAPSYVCYKWSLARCNQLIQKQWGDENQLQHFLLLNLCSLSAPSSYTLHLTSACEHAGAILVCSIWVKWKKFKWNRKGKEKSRQKNQICWKGKIFRKAQEILAKDRPWVWRCARCEWGLFSILVPPLFDFTRWAALARH